MFWKRMIQQNARVKRLAAEAAKAWKASSKRASRASEASPEMLVPKERKSEWLLATPGRLPRQLPHKGA